MKNNEYRYLQPFVDKKKVSGNPGKYLQVLDNEFGIKGNPDPKKSKLASLLANGLASNEDFQQVNLLDEEALNKLKAITEYKPFYNAYNKNFGSNLHEWLTSKREDGNETFGEAGNKFLRNLYNLGIIPNLLSVFDHNIPNYEDLQHSILKQYPRVGSEFVANAGLYIPKNRDINLNLISKTNPNHAFVHEATHAVDHLGHPNRKQGKSLSTDIGTEFLQGVSPDSKDYETIVSTISDMIQDPMLFKRDKGKTNAQEIIAHIVPEIFSEWKVPTETSGIKNESRRYAKRLLHNMHQNLRNNFGLQRDSTVDKGFQQKLQAVRGSSPSPRKGDRINLGGQKQINPFNFGSTSFSTSSQLGGFNTPSTNNPFLGFQSSNPPNSQGANNPFLNPQNPQSGNNSFGGFQKKKQGGIVNTSKLQKLLLELREMMA